MIRRLALALALAAVGSACFAAEPELTDSGKGYPRVSVEFPDEVKARSTHTAVLTVTNPGPGDIDTLRVDFALVGTPAERGEVPPAVVPVGAAREVVLDVSPEPLARSGDGGFVFDGLAEGRSVEISFQIKVPNELGRAANALIVSAGEEPERARGARLETEITS